MFNKTFFRNEAYKSELIKHGKHASSLACSQGFRITTEESNKIVSG